MDLPVESSASIVGTTKKIRLDLVPGSNVYNRVKEFVETVESEPGLLFRFEVDKRTGAVTDVYLVNKTTGEKVY